MHTMFDIKNAVFQDSSIREDVPGFPLGHFWIVINGMRKVVYLGMDYIHPETGKLVKERSYSEDAKLIKNLVPGEIVDLTVNVWDATPKDARRDVFSLAHISSIASTN